jgi:flagella basal body P-ring formation protein FlgA
MAKNKNIDDDTRARARKFVEEKADKPEKEYRSDPFSKMTKAERDARVGYPDDFPPAVVDDATKRLPVKKERVVSKKELEASGLSLRDFLNKERGLTRREDKVEAAKKQLKLGEKVSAEEVEKAKKQLKLAKGGYVNCGASVPPAQKAKK